MKKYDAVIIGFGKGGKTLAGTLAANGKNVLLKRMLTCTEEPASMLDVSHPNHL